MTTIKTAISLQQTLLEQIDALAQELDLSRSHLFALAVEEFLQKHQNHKLLEKINAAYQDEPDPEEQIYQHYKRHKHRKLVEEQWS